MAKVYVSSTIADLQQEREAVIRWLMMARHQVVDSYQPDSETVRDGCLDDLDRCDLYVLLLGHRYGVRHADGNPEGLSMTHLEFRRAGQCYIPRIAMLRTSIPDISPSDIEDPQKLALVLAFRDEINREVRSGSFHDQADLIQGLSTGVEAALASLPPAGRRRGIFLSYRRADTGPYARSLWRVLTAGFPGTYVFMDVGSIDAGANFVEVIQAAVGSSAVLVALIGDQWATVADEQGRRRLDDPDDVVRLEIQTALDRGVRVIPVLIDGTKPLRREQLPAELEKLAQLNALELTHAQYDHGAGQLIEQIQRLFAPGGKLADPWRPPPAEAEDQALAQARDEAELALLEELAHAARKAGDAAAARDRSAALLRARERVSGPDHPDTLAARYNLAYWTGEAGDAAGARDQLAALLPIVERVLGAEHPNTLATRANLAYFTGAAGDAAGARDQYAAQLPIEERALGPEHLDTLTVRANLARWTGRAGDAAGARDQYR